MWLLKKSSSCNVRDTLEKLSLDLMEEANATEREFALPLSRD
jgi:hypothetical protein